MAYVNAELCSAERKRGSMRFAASRERFWAKVSATGIYRRCILWRRGWHEMPSEAGFSI
jgi:hypothetical protein